MNGYLFKAMILENINIEWILSFNIQAKIQSN